LFFVGNDDLTGDELWKTNGRVPGTIPVITDIAERYSNFVRLTRLKNYLYYIGHERLNRTDGTVAGTIIVSGIESTPAWGAEPEALVASTHEADVSVFPNPFNSEFSLQLESEDELAYAVKVVDATGVTMHASRLVSGFTYILGSEWRPGLYLIQLTREDETFTKRIFKR
jgi:ELWxxDGT repeat protein